MITIMIPASIYEKRYLFYQIGQKAWRPLLVAGARGKVRDGPWYIELTATRGNKHE